MVARNTKNTNKYILFVRDASYEGLDIIDEGNNLDDIYQELNNRLEQEDYTEEDTFYLIKYERSTLALETVSIAIQNKYVVAGDMNEELTSVK